MYGLPLGVGGTLLQLLSLALRRRGARFCLARPLFGLLQPLFQRIEARFDAVVGACRCGRGRDEKPCSDGQIAKFFHDFLSSGKVVIIFC
ncbi:hypothetical protein D3C78_1574380 [compost metagenome]